MSRRPPELSRSAVDRDCARRDDEAGLQGAWDRGQVLVVHEGSALVDGTGLVLLPSAQAPAGERFYLGTDGTTPYFAVAAELPRRLGAQAKGLREVGTVLSDRDAGLLVHAVALGNWHATHRFCPRCGAPTESVRGGSVRRCTADASEHFPRTDPAVIVLVTDGGDRCVLGRAAVWPERRFSTLAGFVEPGESAEQAVVREVEEESGLRVRDVVARDSQPWPFPCSLMLGFRAVCDGDASPEPRDGELAEVDWFTRDQLRAAGDTSARVPGAGLHGSRADGAAGDWGGVQGGVRLPPPVSIAHRLITDWLAEG